MAGRPSGRPIWAARFALDAGIQGCGEKGRCAVLLALRGYGTSCIVEVYFSDQFDLQLPAGHRFPGHKYGMLRQALVDEKVIDETHLRRAMPVEVSTVLLAHNADYVSAIEEGTIEPAAMRRIGFPWSPRIPLRARATLGGAVAAAEAALHHGFAGQLAGGTHHAHGGFGSGYCVYNDFAVVARHLIVSGTTRRLAIIDLDVHQGDGNAAILGADENIYILSVHGEKNFPFRKYPSTHDVALPDDTGDGAYLDALDDALAKVWAFSPELVLYQAGVDPLAEDRLGRLSLSFDGLMARDRLVFAGAAAHGIPVSMAIGGGYADPIELSVEAYVNTWRAARGVYRW